MKLPLKLTFRHMRPSDALVETIRLKAARLDETHPLTRCEVALGAPHRHHRNGRLYTARITLTVPGAEVVVSNEPDEDPYVAVRVAFDAARRRLEERLERRRQKRAA